MGRKHTHTHTHTHTHIKATVIDFESFEEGNEKNIVNLSVVPSVRPPSNYGTFLDSAASYKYNFTSFSPYSIFVYSVRGGGVNPI